MEVYLNYYNYISMKIKFNSKKNILIVQKVQEFKILMINQLI